MRLSWKDSLLLAQLSTCDSSGDARGVPLPEDCSASSAAELPRCFMLTSCDEEFAVRELEEPEPLGKLGREERDLRREKGDV